MSSLNLTPLEHVANALGSLDFADDQIDNGELGEALSAIERARGALRQAHRQLETPCPCSRDSGGGSCASQATLPATRASSAGAYAGAVRPTPVRDFIADTDYLERRAAVAVVAVMVAIGAVAGGLEYGALGALAGVATAMLMVVLVVVALVLPVIYLDWVWMNVPIELDGRHSLRRRRDRPRPRRFPRSR